MKVSERVVKAFEAKLGRGFSSPEALADYLHEHPLADRKRHWIEESKDEPKKQEHRTYKSSPMSDPAKAARVGLPGTVVQPPPAIPRLKGLQKDELAVESKLNEAIELDPQGVANAFYEVAKSNKWVFETDGAKALMPEWTRPDLPPDEKGKPLNQERAEFRGKYNAVLHQGANAIAKRAFLKRLDDISKMPEDDRIILVTSGGVAGGKGSALAARPELAESVSATWDAAGEQNATENEWLLAECQKRGVRPVFMFVSADPRQAWPGAIERAKSIGRTVDARLFADSYAVGAKNFNSFYEAHKDEVDFVFAKAGGKGKPAEIVDAIPPEALELDSDDIYNFASQYVDERKNELPPHIYHGATIGRRIWDEKHNA